MVCEALPDSARLPSGHILNHSPPGAGGAVTQACFPFVCGAVISPPGATAQLPMSGVCPEAHTCLSFAEIMYFHLSSPAQRCLPQESLL